MKKALLTVVNQYEVKIVTEKDAPDTYAKNLPPGGKSNWQLIEFSNGDRMWHPVHSHTFATPTINDHGKIKLEVAS